MNIYKTITTIILIVLGITFSINSFGQKIPVSTNSMIARAHYERGMDFENQHLYKDAALAFQKAMLADSTFALAYARFASRAGSLKIPRPERLKYYEHAIKLAQDASSAEQKLITAYRTIQIEKNGKKALSIVEELKNEFPDDISVLQQLGNIYYFRFNDYEAATRVWREGIKRHPNISRFFNNVGYALRAQKKYQEAEGVYKEAINKFPWELNVYDSLADLYVEMKEFDKAIELYKVCISIDPDCNSKNDMENALKLKDQ